MFYRFPINMVRTTIVVESSTRDKLKQFGLKGETYEDIILKLIKYYEEGKAARTQSKELAAQRSHQR
jgi:hypothetical protein